MNGIDFISSYMPLTYCLYIDWLIAMKKARADSFFHSHNYTCREDNKRTRSVFLKCRTYIYALFEVRRQNIRSCARHSTAVKFETTTSEITN